MIVGAGFPRPIAWVPNKGGENPPLHRIAWAQLDRNTIAYTGRRGTDTFAQLQTALNLQTGSGVFKIDRIVCSRLFTSVKMLMAATPAAPRLSGSL
jgi:hypothetical protein